MVERIIPLKYNRKDFEEIYFKNNKGSLFFSPTTRSKTIFAFIIGIMLVFLYFYRLATSELYYFLSFLFLASLFYLFVGVITVAKWKNGIVKYLDSLENNTLFELELSKDLLIINIDYQEDYIQWKEFTRIEAKNDYIFLQSENLNYLFPKKSMVEEDYIFFKELIKKILTQ